VPAFLRGFIVCDGCGTTATVTAKVSARDHTDLWWDLPTGWQLFGRGHNGVIVYCSRACNTNGASMGYPDQQGRGNLDPATFDVRTLDKLYELIEIGAKKSTGADNVLAAIEAVLIAWRQRPKGAS
jgi:hypothetical protein